MTTTAKPTAFKVRVTHTDGTVTTSPCFAFRTIAASSVRELRKRADVASAEVIEA